MAPSSGPVGYRRTAKTLHWLTAGALLAQFMVGYVMTIDDDGSLVADSKTLLPMHLLLGALVITLALVRIVWRRRVGLPPWAETLSAGERRLAHGTERALLALIVVIPVSGAAVLLLDAPLAVHVAAHVAFFVALAAHLGLVLKHQLVDRDRLLARML